MTNVSSHGPLWRALDEERIIYFGPPPSQRYKLLRFDSREDADWVLSRLELGRHAAIGRPCPVLQVNEEGPYIAWEIFGRKLHEVDPSDFKTGNHWISFFYQQLFRILFSVIKYMQMKGLSWEYDMSNIYVKDVSKPTIFLIGFKKGAKNFDEEFAALCALIQQINIHCSYHGGDNTEMDDLLDCLNPDTRSIQLEAGCSSTSYFDDTV